MSNVEQRECCPSTFDPGIRLATLFLKLSIDGIPSHLTSRVTGALQRVEPFVDGHPTICIGRTNSIFSCIPTIRAENAPSRIAHSLIDAIAGSTTLMQMHAFSSFLSQIPNLAAGRVHVQAGGDRMLHLQTDPEWRCPAMQPPQTLKLSCSGCGQCVSSSTLTSDQRTRGQSMDFVRMKVSRVSCDHGKVVEKLLFIVHGLRTYCSRPDQFKQIDSPQEADNA